MEVEVEAFVEVTGVVVEASVEVMKASMEVEASMKAVEASMEVKVEAAVEAVQAPLEFSTGRFRGRLHWYFHGSFRGTVLGFIGFHKPPQAFILLNMYFHELPVLC